MRWQLAIGCLALFLLVGGCDRDSAPVEQGRVAEQTQATQEDPTQAMLTAIAAGNWQAADRYSKLVLIAHPDDPDLITKVALVAAQRDRKREAAQLLVSAARAGNFRPASRVNYAVQGLIDVGEIYAAIELLEESLRAFPEEHQQRRILIGFLAEVQRPEKIPQHLEVLIRNRQFDFPLLFATTDTSTRRMSEQTVDSMIERNPSDYRVRLADAFLLLYRRDVNGAGEVLEEILEHHPEFAPAHALYGRILTTQSRWDELPNWLQTAPKESRQYADYWLTLGDVALENGQLVEAVRGYWEAGQRDPNNSQTWDRLALTIQRLQASDSPNRKQVSEEQLAIVIDYASRLQGFREQFNHFTASDRQSQREAIEVAKRLFELGRTWEAEAWWAAASTLKEDRSEELEALHESIIQQLRKDPAWFARTTPALKLDFSTLPTPQIGPAVTRQERSEVIPPVAATDALRMTERSDQWGLAGVGAGNTPDDAKLAPLIRSTGVGGGAIDYDLDGNPDLLMMNAGGTMLQQDSKPNDLMRNLGDQFTRVTGGAGVGDTGFGQGVAIGDFNEDGFADLFFANLGQNRLLRNNGDGTFTDCTDLLVGDLLRTWSTSAAFVDIDGDAITDLFVTNYCQPVPNLDKACPNEEGVLGPCHPLKFPADTDVVFRGVGDGSFVNVTEDWIGSPLPGRGLGIVSGTISGDQFGLFVANDMSRNSFYSPQNAEGLKLTDTASIRGVAVDGMSRSQASMGIASSDFDRDGDIDFYVTGFGREYNVYYEQVSPGLWKDESSRLGLIEPTLMVIGFGTQPIDIESDGIDEIIVTNGHIGEFSAPDAPDYDLPLQIFRRNTEGTFALLDDDAWGDYFRLPHVGRALWTTDVNRDGRNDVLITHMSEQVRLLINESTDTNHRIGFKLTGTESSRDAAGAVIRFRCDNQPRTLWMLAGDGYFCTNEKTLIAGLGQATEVTDVTVTWQDGSVDAFDRLSVDACYLIVQGQNEAFEMNRYEP